MMYLDVEFNGFHSETISLALVTDDGDVFYEVLTPLKAIHPWVAKHVMPVLNKDPISRFAFRSKLWLFLMKHQSKTIVADWPEDFSHLMWWACAEDGMAPNIQLNMNLIQSGKLESTLPHNALADALALKKWCEEQR